MIKSALRNVVKDLMAYYATLAERKYTSWDHNLVIIQEIRQQASNNKVKQETKLNVNYKVNNKDYETEWLPYPFKQNQNIVTVLEQLIPILKAKENTMLPIVELNQGKSSGQLCSCYVLSDGTEVKQYLPMTRTITDYKNTRLRHDKLVLSTGEEVLSVEPNKVVAILNK